jgi:dolichyl-phosphate beta-glucosyltransferase
MFFSVIIPAFNEERRIKKTLLETGGYLVKSGHEHEIIVINDGSTDLTSEVVGGLKMRISNLRLVNNAKNRGKGFAVRQGLLEARGEYRLFMDADNSTGIKEIENFLPYFMQGYDIVIGSRDIKGSLITNPQPFYRRILGSVYGFISKLITGLWEFKDTQCGFKMFAAKAVIDVVPRCQINGWSFDSEILLAAKKRGYKIKEAPVRWENDARSKVRLSGMAGALIDLFRIRAG